MKIHPTVAQKVDKECSIFLQILKSGQRHVKFCPRRIIFAKSGRADLDGQVDCGTLNLTFLELKSSPRKSTSSPSSCAAQAPSSCCVNAWLNGNVHRDSSQ